MHKTFLAGIDFTTSDERVVMFASLFNRIFKPEKVTFFHITNEESKEDLDAGAKLENDIKRRVSSFLDQILPPNFAFDVKQGNPEEKIIEQSKEEKVDLIILGRKMHEKNEILTDTLINTSGSSLCLIPDHAEIKLNNLVVATDFSEQSQIGLEVALAIAKEKPVNVHCLHVYTVPSGYHTSGKTYEEYAEVMKENAIKAAGKFKKRYPNASGLSFDFVLDEDDEPSDKLYEYSEASNADLVILGSRGLSTLASFFFDTTSEKLVEFSSNIPLLIVKSKNNNRSLLDAIRAQ